MLEGIVLSANSFFRIEGVVILLFSLPIIVFLVQSFYSKTYPYAMGWPFRALVFLRSIVFFLLICLLIEPTIQITTKVVRNPGMLMLVDTSSSMAVLEGDVSRLDRVRNFFGSDLWENQAKKLDFRAWRFAETAYPVALDSLEKLKAEGRSTNLGATLRSIVRNTVETPNSRGVLLITDGIHNAGLNPLEVTENFSLPIFSLSIGESSVPADLKIISAQSKGPNYTGKELAIRVKFMGGGFKGRSSELVAYEKDQELTRIPIDFTGEIQEIELTIPSSDPGPHLYRLKLLPLEGEITHINNELMTWSYVQRGKLKVLLIASRPNSEAAFLFRALNGDSTLSVTRVIRKNSTELYEGKWGDELLKSHDIFVLVGYDPEMWSDQMSSVLEMEIGNGKGLLWIGGTEGFGNALQFFSDEFFPFEISNRLFSQKDVVLRLFKDDLQHSVLSLDLFGLSRNWDAMPPLKGLYPVTLLRPNAQVLIESGEGEPIFVSSGYRSGKMFFAFSQSFWSLDLTSRGLMTNPDIISRFWQNTIRWLGTKFENDRIEVTSDRPIYRAGTTVIFSGRLTGGSSTDLEQNCNVSVEIDTGEFIDLKLQPNGIFLGRWLAPPSGEYHYQPSAKCGDLLIEGDKGKVVVDTYSVEWVELRANIPLLESLGEITGGSVVPLSRASDLFEYWDFKQDVVPEIYVFRLGDSSTTLLLIVTLLVIEWWIRRRVGMV